MEVKVKIGIDSGAKKIQCTLAAEGLYDKCDSAMLGVVKREHV